LTNAGELFLENAKRLLRLNDEIYAEMNARPVQGSVRIGIPHDLIATSMVPILKAFSEDFPDVDISIQCGSSLELLALVKSGGVDLALAEAPLKAATGECLVEERLVWVGARGGQAYRKKPLPVSLVSNTCAFHPVISQILRAGNRDWRTIHEGGSVEATAGAVLADLAVSAWLSASIPADLETLTKDDGLPDLPPFAIELHVARGKRHRAVDAMIRYIREGFGSRHALERIAQAS
jgi:DNA-binding transcriptional LysR family regulator